jgi:chromosomal replication initiator protein
VITLTSAEEWRNQFYSATNGENENCDLPQTARTADLLIVEDVQYLADGNADAFGQLVSELYARQVQMIFTSSKGPNELALPSRLRSRLVSGLVVALEPLQAPSRLKLLEDKAERRQLAVSREVLSWVAEHLTGAGRQLDGALVKLECLCRTHPRVLNVATVAAHFQDEVHVNRPSMEKIATRVGGYFRVEPQQLQSEKRGHNVLLPRQVSMYLARQLTDLSLGRIGAYFGGRDHSTVLHACRKVASAINRDPVLSGTIRQIQAELA